MISAPSLAGWRHVYSGKVRDLYQPDDGSTDRVLVVASDRISAHDFVLDSAIPDKGAILTALSLWWFDRIGGIVPHHVVSLDVPAPVRGRAMICANLTMYPVECVARGYLAGSGLAEYSASGAVCGVALPDGLVEGSRLPAPIFTPALKAADGEHDENVPFERVVETIGADDAARLRDVTLAIYDLAARVAAERGLILSDTKFEFGRDPQTGDLVLGDEVLTPDSSRYWPAENWHPGQAQASFDKQYLRDWLTSAESGWDRYGDAPPPPLPAEVIERTRERYLDAYRRLTGEDFESSR